MLSLQLKSGEYLTIGDDIAIQIFEGSGSSFRVAVKAPREVPILRGEVHERTGQRPDGLHTSRPKSPSERRYSARHLEQWADKRDARADRQARADQERAAILRDLTALSDHVAQLSPAQGDAALPGQLRSLCQRLAALPSAAD